MKSKKIFILVLIHLCIFAFNAQSNQQITKDVKVEHFKNYVHNLDLNDKESLEKMRVFFYSMFRDDSKSTEDAFRFFRKTHQEMIRRADSGLYKRKDLQYALYKILKFKMGNQQLPPIDSIDEKIKNDISSKHLNALNDLYELNTLGVVFYNSEGDWYLSADNNFYLDKLLKRYNLPLKEYLLFAEREGRKPLIEDGGLVGTFEDLRSKIVIHEQFISKYPELPEAKEEVLRNLNFYVRIYLNGISNTPIEENQIEVINSYKLFLKENTDSEYYSKVRDKYTELTNN